MTSIDDLKHDLKGVSDTVLGNLSTEERIRTFAKEAAEGNEERLEQLADTAPRKEYRATDLDYLNGIKKVGVLSLQARHELQKRYQVITEHETTRDKHMALLMLNESLSRLTRGTFEIDEFGHFDAPSHADGDYAYGKKRAPDTAYLATKYRELWEDVPAELLVAEDDREIKQLPELAAAGLLSYPSDLSSDVFDDLDDDRISSEVYQSEVRLLNALVDFHTRYHGWRLFAEEHLDIALDELLGISSPEGEDGVGVTHGIAEIDEQLCENVLSLKRDYLEAYPVLLEEWTGDKIDVDLDARAQNSADGLADAVDLP
jgi:hypothetical protein